MPNMDVIIFIEDLNVCDKRSCVFNVSSSPIYILVLYVKLVFFFTSFLFRLRLVKDISVDVTRVIMRDKWFYVSSKVFTSSEGRNIHVKDIIHCFNTMF